MTTKPGPRSVEEVAPAAGERDTSADRPRGADRERIAIRVTGIVQGVGFRPFVYGLGTSLGLAGQVGNDDAGVFAEAEGDPAAIAEFLRRLSDDAPPGALIERVTVERVTVERLISERLPPAGGSSFTIVASRDAGPGAAVTLISPDTAVCADCLAEVRDPADRRYRYPFTACAHCGPRYTIVRGVPYDRAFTTMAGFPLCADCASEYQDPASRRFHAQPTACPACGPRLYFERVAPDAPAVAGAARTAGDTALADAVAVLRDGGIVAVRGIGGYHLACDARSPAAVARLRERKHRSAKPFAVLTRDLAVAATLGEIDQTAAGLLTSREAPVVIVPVAGSAAAAAVAGSVAPRNGSIGLLLPYTPLHHLLLTPHPDLPGPVPDTLVLTSGNLSDEPLVTEPEQARIRLAGIADAWLHHDRPIHVACDDSVVRVVDGAAQPVRRSRGYAPLPVRLPLRTPPVLAVGGELKTTICLSSGRRAWLSQHVGDTGNYETLDLLARVADTLSSLARIRPEMVAADLHPGYLSRRWAEQRAAATGAEFRQVQHHHAHLAALLAEHEVPPGEPVLGMVFDGTGYGDDGTIWGGELLLGTYREVTRAGHLAPVALPGGDSAIRRPARTALAHLHAAAIEWDDRLPPAGGTMGPAADPGRERRVIARMLATGTGCVPTTSMGRLFDAVSSLAGVCHDASYEGQAAIELEALAAGWDGAGAPGAAGDPPDWRYDVRADGGSLILDPAPVLRAAVSAVLGSAPPGQVAAAFHAATADAVTRSALAIRDATGVATVGLTGGVFQNSVLTRACRSRLERHQMTVLVHRKVPPNDGGLALGQAAVVGAGGGS